MPSRAVDTLRHIDIYSAPRVFHAVYNNLVALLCNLQMHVQIGIACNENCIFANRFFPAESAPCAMTLIVLSLFISKFLTSTYAEVGAIGRK